MLETDEDDFMPSSSGNLSSIFNTGGLSDDHASLSYRAPKQPKAMESNCVASVANPVPDSRGKVPQSQSSVILAKVITLWKLNNGQNKLMGKHIAAIIGNATHRLYDVIVYQEKTNILIRQPLNESLTLYKYPKNFIGIFDNQKQFWNLNFDSLENLESFLKEVSAHKCQIIEQNSQSNSNDQVDTKESVDNFTDTVESVNSGKTEPSVYEHSKDKILSRITKMGQQIFPKGVVERKSSPSLSDSETESSYSDSKPVKPTTAPRKLRRNQNHDKALVAPIGTDSNIVHTSYSSNSNQLLPNSNQMVLNPHGMIYAQPYPDYSVNNYIIAQNAELKANLAEINLKLSNVLSVQSGGVDRNGNSEESDSLKSRIKCLNLKIDNLEAELEKSKKSAAELKNKYEEKCVELSREQERRESDKNLAGELDKLKEKLELMELLENKIKKLSLDIEEKDKLIEIQRLKMQDFEEYYKEHQTTKDNLTKEIANQNLQIEELLIKTKKYEEELKQKENSVKGVKENYLASDKILKSKKVKEVMNEAFRCIMEDFEENGQYSFREIQEVVLDNLKNATYGLISALE